PVHVQPGLHPSSVTAAIGYGRAAAGKVGTQAGVDVFPLMGQKVVQLRKTGRFYKLAATQWHSVTENRPIINDITLAEFRKNPGEANETDPELRANLMSMWPVHE